MTSNFLENIQKIIKDGGERLKSLSESHHDQLEKFQERTMTQFDKYEITISKNTEAMRDISGHLKIMEEITRKCNK